MATVIANNGCKIHDDCLTCPLPECIYVTGYVTEIRRMSGLMDMEGIAKKLRVHVRTVRRALKEQ